MHSRPQGITSGLSTENGVYVNAVRLVQELKLENVGEFMCKFMSERATALHVTIMSPHLLHSRRHHHMQTRWDKLQALRRRRAARIIQVNITRVKA